MRCNMLANFNLMFRLSWIHLVLIAVLWLGLLNNIKRGPGINPISASTWVLDLISMKTLKENQYYHLPLAYQHKNRQIRGNGHHHHQPKMPALRRKSVRETSKTLPLLPPFAASSPVRKLTSQLRWYPSSNSDRSLRATENYIHQFGENVQYPERPITRRIQNLPQNLVQQEVAICNSLTGLTTQQRHICVQHSGLVWAMLEGTQLSLYECVHQFRHEQWNCSAVNLLYRMGDKPSSVPNVSGLEGILQRGSKETAFLSSAWSAGVVQAVTRACSRGHMNTCDCDPDRREGQDQDTEGTFTWGGCSDPIKFGMRLTRIFLDANDQEQRNAALLREQELHGHRLRQNMNPVWPAKLRLHGKTRFIRSILNITNTAVLRQSLNSSFEHQHNRTNEDDVSNMHGLSPQELQIETLRIIQIKARTLMNLHNRKAGRKFVWKSRIVKCKCHGVSGACSLRTCWQRVNEFRRVGAMLKVAYDNAVRVSYEPRLDILRRVKVNRYGQSIRHYGTQGYRTFHMRPDGDQRINWFGPVNQPVGTQHNMRTSRRSRWPRESDGFRGIPKGKLIFLEESPNYCRFDASIGHLGITGRQCNGTHAEAPNSCRRLCCRNGYDAFKYEIKTKCECKFFWCCEVRCKICSETRIVHRCKQDDVAFMEGRIGASEVNFDGRIDAINTRN